MKKRSLIIGLLVMLAVITSGFTYAYWATAGSPTNDTAVGTINIGEGGEVTTTLSVADQAATAGILLVPLEQSVETPTDDPLTVSAYQFSFTVNWTGAGVTGAEGTLTVTPGTALINEVDYSHLFTVSVISGDGDIVVGTSNTVVIEVEFTNEPANYAEYLLVANGALTVNLTFGVVAD
jgi:hypothetical protein